jgi:hypothetical protein
MQVDDNNRIDTLKRSLQEFLEDEVSFNSINNHLYSLNTLLYQHKHSKCTLSIDLKFLKALDGKYIDRIKQTIQDGKFRLLVNVNDLRNWNREFTEKLVRSSFQLLSIISFYL